MAEKANAKEVKKALAEGLSPQQLAQIDVSLGILRPGRAGVDYKSDEVVIVSPEGL